MARHGIYPRAIIPPVFGYYDSRQFGRVFGKLPPISSDTPRIRKALMDIGAVDGPMDVKEKLDADRKDLIVDLNLSEHNNNPKMSAGMTFLGQFLDHDMTFDPTSSLARQADPEHIANSRTPSLGLDNVYGAGPGGSPHLYDRHDGDKFLLEETGTLSKFDVPRNNQMIALIGDQRDDENLTLSQLQVAFLRFHNALLDYLCDELGLDGGDVFPEAQRIVRCNYQ